MNTYQLDQDSGKLTGVVRVEFTVVYRTDAWDLGTLRQQIVDAIVTRFKDISTAGGYQTDLGTRVFLGRTTEPVESECPALNIWDTDEDNARRLNRIHEHRLKIQAFVYQAGSTVAGGAYVRKAVADIFKAIGVDVTWGGLALDTEPS